MPRHDPFQEMYERMNELFREVAGEEFQPGTGLPVDVQETDRKLIVRADMPGVDRDNIRLKIRDNTLHIAAETERELHEEGKDYVRKERSTKSHSRRVQLPVPVDETSATAEYEDGVLTVKVDKLETDSGTDIEIE